MLRRNCWFGRVVSIYGLAIGLWFMLRWWFFDRLWWLLVLNSIALYLFLPLLPLLLLALLRRHSRALFALGVPVVVFGALFGSQLLPISLRGSTPPAGRTLTAMSFNVLYTNRDFPALLAAIHAAQPDIVGFQELTPKISQALLGGLSADYPYHTFTSAERMSGVALMSRFPIRAVASFPLPPRNLSLHVSLDVEGQPLDVVVVHLQPSRLGVPLDRLPAAATTFYALRQGELAAIEREVHGARDPLVLLCDCNMPDTSQAHEQMSAFLVDSFREAGWGFGLTSHFGPLPFPTQRLDYVWHSAGLTALAISVGAAGGSDHFPVVARLVLISR